MKPLVPILSITGSDGTGQSGIQSDIKIIKDLGGYALTVVTSVTIQSSSGISYVREMPSGVVVGQIRAVCEDLRPLAVKVGMVGDAETVHGIRDAISGCPNIVCSPVILSSSGRRLMDDGTVQAFLHDLVPISKMVVMKCGDAEMLFGRRIGTDDDMLAAAAAICQAGTEWVMLRGSRHSEDRVTALLYGRGYHAFFSSYSVEGWQRHGIGGASSTAIATRMAFGDAVDLAVAHAHEYLHSQMVYSVEVDGVHLRPKEHYNRFVSLIAEHYRRQHDVAFYARRMAVTPRYLSQITKAVIHRTPKQVIDEYLLQKARQLLSTTQNTVQEISLGLGFSSQILFARFFRQREGCPPREYRRRMAKDVRADSPALD